MFQQDDLVKVLSTMYFGAAHEYFFGGINVPCYKSRIYTRYVTDWIRLKKTFINFHDIQCKSCVSP